MGGGGTKYGCTPAEKYELLNVLKNFRTEVLEDIKLLIYICSRKSYKYFKILE
jgi:hypothetical protein